MLLEELLDLLDQTPAIVDIHPVSLCYLPQNVRVLNSVAEAAWLLDDPKPVLPERLLILAPDNQYNGRFPYVRCEHDPFTPALNTILFDRYGAVSSRMLCQSQIAEYILAEANQQEVIIFFLIDGLSYQDVRFWGDLNDHVLSVQPCLVDVPTLTHVAFPNLIGAPSLAVKLFNLGYHHRLGFTYWTREDNPLTDRLFQSISEVKKIGYFPLIVETLRQYIRSAQGNKIYIQLVRTGLDGYAHAQKRQPPVTAIVAEIFEEFRQLVMLCEEFGERATVYLTADHGILWSNEFTPKIVGNAPVNSSARWCNWRDLYHQSEPGRRFLVNGDEYYCLGFPKIRRSLHIDEQGVHGGISFQEAIVPFVSYHFRDK